VENVQLEKQRTVEDAGFNLKIADYFMRRAKPYLKSPVLDVGCGVGVVTRYVADLGFNVYGVDGNREKIVLAEKRVPEAEFETAYLEKFSPSQRFGTVILKNVLEHFTEQEAISNLLRVKGWLSEDGVLIVYVPSKTSLHKRIWYAMGKDPTLGALTPLDREVGHQQIYSKESLLRQLSQAGFTPVYVRGLLVKPSPNRIMAFEPDAYCDALFRVADDGALVDVCSGVFCVCS